MKDLKACYKPHPVTHTVFGIGLGLVLVALFRGSIGANALVLGLILAVGALAYDYLYVKD